MVTVDNLKILGVSATGSGSGSGGTPTDVAWNPETSAAKVDLSNNFLTVDTNSSSGGATAIATTGVSEGYKSWEITIGASEGDGSQKFGIALDGHDNTVAAGDTATSYCFYPYAQNKINNGISQAYGEAVAENDVITVGFDADNGELEFFKDGVSLGIAYSGIPAGTYYPVTSHDGSISNQSSTAKFTAPFSQTVPPNAVEVGTTGGEKSQALSGLLANLTLSCSFNETSDGSSPVTRVDQTGNGHDFTNFSLNVGSDLGLGGQQAAELGTNKKLNTPHDDLLTIHQNLTLSFWFKPTGSLGTNYLVVKYSNTYKDYQIYISSNTFQVRIGRGTTSTIAVYNSGVTVTVGTWYHLVFIHDLDNKSAYLWVNGTENTLVTGYSGDTELDPACDTALSINGSNSNSSSGINTNGLIQNIDFWSDRILTPSEIAALDDNGVPLAFSQYANVSSS